MLTQPDRFDVAVLKLDHPVDYEDNILPICLPTSDYDLVGKVGVVGKDSNTLSSRINVHDGINVYRHVQPNPDSQSTYYASLD